jgi:hypothetical protein
MTRALARSPAILFVAAALASGCAGDGSGSPDSEHLELGVHLPNRSPPRAARASKERRVVRELTDQTQVLDELVPALNDPLRPGHAPTGRREC